MFNGLPFLDEEIESILEDSSFVVDMNNIGFEENKEENFRISMIYLRNINYLGNLDFSFLTYKDKALFLKMYISRDIKFLKLKELDMTILNMFMLLKREEEEEIENFIFPSILTRDEMNIFINDNLELLQEMLSFIISLPVFLISRVKTEQLQIEDDIEKTDVIPKSLDCVFSLLDYQETEFIFYTIEDNIIPKFYTKIFTEASEILFSKLINTSFSILLNLFTTEMNACFQQNSIDKIKN